MMHHALLIDEILSNIFGHYDIESHRVVLASLARTCRAFKEPALDKLWSRLPDLSPLARCLPEASKRLSRHEYSFHRQLTQTEWDILQNYTHCIQSIDNLGQGLDEKSLAILSNFPTAEPLFQNLRYLYYEDTPPSVRNILHLPFPSLISIDALLDDPHSFPLESFSKFSPNLRILSLDVEHPDVTFNKSISSCISRWRNIQRVSCTRVILDADALLHLSRAPALTSIDSSLPPTLPAFDSLLIFSGLDSMSLHSKSLHPISQLVSHARLPTLTSFYAELYSRPSRERLSTFWESFLTSNACSSLRNFSLHYLPNSSARSKVLLTIEDLGPCTAFGNLESLEIETGWDIGLKDKEILALVSAWPRLQYLKINRHFGWNRGGLTPAGLVQLLQKCPLLQLIALTMDTRGYVEIPERGLLQSLTSPRPFSIFLLDSYIEAESVPALAVFFARTHYCEVYFDSWDGEQLPRPQEWELHSNRWRQVLRLTMGYDEPPSP